MPTTTVVYPSAITEVGAGTAWTDPTNAEGAPDDINSATASLGLAATSKILLGGPNRIAIQVIPADAIIRRITVTPRASTDDVALETTVLARLYSGTTAIGSADSLQMSGGTTLTDYSLGTLGWGTPLTRGMLDTLRVGVYITASTAAAVAVNAFGVTVTWTTPERRRFFRFR